jgi:F-type H+-transporting ATPase subunit a
VIEHGHIEAMEEGRTVIDFSITKNVAAMFLSVILLFWVFFSVKRGYSRNAGKAPKGIQSFFEPIILFIRDEVAIPNIGPKYEKYLPYLLSIFFFIWFNNMLGLFPGSANVTGNIAVTMTLALFTFIFTQISGNRQYWRHIFNTPGVPWWLKVPIPIMPLVELIGVFTKPFSLTVRLFANITAGHIIILSLFSLIFIFESLLVGPLSVLFAIFMNFLELFVALLQAFIFTILSAMYFGSAVEERHHDESMEQKVV